MTTTKTLGPDSAELLFRLAAAGQGLLNERYALLDPTLPATGPYRSRDPELVQQLEVEVLPALSMSNVRGILSICRGAPLRSPWRATAPIQPAIT